MEEAPTLARVQFGLNIGFHILFPAHHHRPVVAAGALASFAQGFMLGRYITGFQYGAGFWLFAVLVGASLCGGYVLLGATWLILRTDGELQRKSIGWARWGLLWVALGVALVSLARRW